MAVAPASLTPSLAELTARELEVLALMAEGKANATIAAELTLTDKTIESHVRSIFIKLGVKWNTALHRRVAAVVVYLRATAVEGAPLPSRSV